MLFHSFTKEGLKPVRMLGTRDSTAGHTWMDRMGLMRQLMWDTGNDGD